MLKHGILGLLNYRDLTGYEIMTAFRDSLHFFWNAQTSQIYRELQTLERNGWVGKTPVYQQGKPDKNVYAITQEGREELLQWLSDGELGAGSRSHILMKVFFLGERSREENICYFEGLKEYCGMMLQNLDVARENIKTYSNILNMPDKAVYWEMTVDYGRRNMQMQIDWAESCIERLKKKED